MAFVKFSRGLLSTYNNLSQKDPDTLYLVYETQSSDKGFLYLGNKLISSVSSSSESVSLANLSDVSLDDNLAEGMILQYNATTGGGVWEAVPASEIIPAGFSNDISFVDALNEISNPSQTDIAIINGDTYIYDGENWLQLTNSELNNRISQLEAIIGQPSDDNNSATGLYADIENIEEILNNVYTKSEIDSQIAQQVAEALVNAQHLKYKVVSSLAEAESEADENIIYLVPKSETDTNNEYDEYFIVEGNLEKIGNWEVELSNYVRTDDPRIEAIQLDSNDNLVITAAQVSDLQNIITQSQIIESVAPGVFNIVNKELQLVGIPANLLNDYVTQVEFNAKVGDLNLMQDRVSASSSLVDEINTIKSSLTWQEVSAQVLENND